MNGRMNQIIANILCAGLLGSTAPAFGQSLDHSGAAVDPTRDPLYWRNQLPGNQRDTTGLPATQKKADQGSVAGEPGCVACDDSMEGEANCAVPTDTVNGGCNSSPPVFASLQCGHDFCGTFASDGEVRDTDWWMFVLQQTSIVNLTVTADSPVQIGFGNLSAGCPISALVEGVFGDACTPTNISLTLNPGSYIAFVAPRFGDPVACGARYRGVLNCEAVGACCLPSFQCAILTQGACTAQDGFYRGDNTSCESYTATRGAVAIEDIQLGGTRLAAGEPGEDASTTIPIGFTFKFHNNDYTQLRINDNGYVSFSGGDGSASWVPAFGSVEPNNLIAVAWTDLSSRLPLASPEFNGVFYENRTSPNRLIVQWHRVSTYTENSTAMNQSTFQVILYEGSNDIEIRWGNLDNALVNNLARVGLENIDGSRTQTVANARSGESQVFAYTLSCATECPGDRGDTNCDGRIDFFDIDPFLLALFDLPTYRATFCGSYYCAADVDCSNAIDFFDVDPFLGCLFSSCPACP